MATPRKLYARILETQQALRAIVFELQDQVLRENMCDATKAMSCRAHELLFSLRQLLDSAPDEPSARLGKADADALQLVVDTMDRALFVDTPQ